MPATLVEKRMTMPEIKAKARDLGITPGKMKKTELIHRIQSAEQCTPCYGTSNVVRGVVVLWWYPVMVVVGAKPGLSARDAGRIAFGRLGHGRGKSRLIAEEPLFWGFERG